MEPTHYLSSELAKLKKNRYQRGIDVVAVFICAGLSQVTERYTPYTKTVSNLL